MAEVKISEFWERLKGIKGARRRSLIGGIHYRIRTGVSREVIDEYLDSCLNEKAENTAVMAANDNQTAAMVTSTPKIDFPMAITLFKSFDFLETVQSLKDRYLYVLCRASIYIAVIGTSYRPIESFFATLDIFGGEFAAALSAAIAVAVDVVAMDLFARGVWHAVCRRYIRAVGLIAPALIIVCGNIYVTRNFMSSRLGIAELDDRKKEWSSEVQAIKSDVIIKEQDYSAKRGRFLALKWRGAMEPERCESGEIICSGPYKTLAQIAQAEFLSADTALNLVNKKLERAKSERPISTSISNSEVKKRVLVYTVFWFVILLTYIYEPKKV